MSRATPSLCSTLKTWQLILFLLLAGYVVASADPVNAVPAPQEADDEDDEDDSDYDEDEDEDDEDSDEPTPPPAPPKPKGREQSGRIEGETKFTWVDAEPYFMMQIPKKPKGLRDQWVFINKEARLEERLSDVKAKIEVEEEKEGTEDHDKRLQALLDEKSKIERQYQKVFMICEDWPKGQNGWNQSIEIKVDRASKDQKIHTVNMKEAVKQNWKDIRKIQDQDITSKRDRKANRFTWVYEATGTHNNGGDYWGRFVTYLVYSRQGTTRYVVQYQHLARLDKYEADKKAFTKAANALWASFKLP